MPTASTPRSTTIIRAAAATDALVRWRDSLPADVERGDIPSQADADLWVRDRTLGLIEKLPVTLDPTVVLSPTS
jgi:hypothetical protein